MGASKEPTDICLSQVRRIEECVDLDQLVFMIVQIRDYLVWNGCYFPSLTAILDSCREIMRKDGVEIDDAEFEALREEFEKYDRHDDVRTQQIKNHHHKKHGKHKKDKELKINSKTAMGFIKFVGGTLLCFVPVPLIQTAGVSLAALGVSEMVDGVREDSDKKEWEERMDSNRRIDNGMDQFPR